jgi:hypothetical protein
LAQPAPDRVNVVQTWEDGTNAPNIVHLRDAPLLPAELLHHRLKPLQALGDLNTPTDLATLPGYVVAQPRSRVRQLMGLFVVRSRRLLIPACQLHLALNDPLAEPVHRARGSAVQRQDELGRTVATGDTVQAKALLRILIADLRVNSGGPTPARTRAQPS